MKKLIIVVLIACMLCSITTIQYKTEAAPGVSASNAVVLDMDTNEILFEKQAHESRNIASITKIMTAIVALEHGELDDQVLITPNAAHKEGSSIYTKAGDIYSLEDLIYGLLLRSGNDAATAIAEHIAGSEKGFAFLMNQKARWIGMNDSSFQNPHGLDEEGHYSSAYDMALLTSYAMNTNKTFRKMFGTKKHLSENIDYHWFNKNKLLMTNEYCTGGKTGFTKSAGRTLVTTAELDGKRVVVVTLNASSDWSDHRALYDYGFEQLIEKDEELGEGFFEFPAFFKSYFDVFNKMHGVTEWST
ncbi:D-alanyl-D-alanine carboxypeptidase [Filobacillus milosensis]|uniref:D-alanyl-D-alanine carboxypeptidase n=1 Tax=Filobacillus milosensis TaxID=94137 RepID=A0A4Y8ISM1_9BACI|nr:D-alanyl-D-alanine carboxypeptidase family protein [Filobacillus milosensis]TFB23930.1 D-alanyl-D-alanine carboxypeptidase [Filobacillus milosensis]